MNLEIILKSDIPQSLKAIAKKVFDKQRITPQEGLLLYEKAGLPYLGMLAAHIREQKHGKKTFFNRNFHIEPTNICIYSCKFCSYVRKINQEGAWEHTIPDIEDLVNKHKPNKPTEVHIVGGVHPKRDLHYYGEMIQKIKSLMPGIHVKAFTAVELEFMIKKAKLNLKSGLLKLKEYGLDSIPGGGAEIFAPEIRTQVCDEKSTAEMWLNIHKTAHEAGIPSNATILYGHIENYEHRIDHLNRLRSLQDTTHGFNTFIPLKYRNQNNSLSEIGEVSLLEDLRNFAVSRIFLDNIPHLKAYWPMLGKQKAQLALNFGVDDMDGTIDDSTKIYSMAGVEDENPKMTTQDIVELIKEAGFQAIERDTLYNTIKEY